jgi:hypothetical protein
VIGDLRKRLPQELDGRIVVAPRDLGMHARSECFGTLDGPHNDGGSAPLLLCIHGARKLREHAARRVHLELDDQAVELRQAFGKLPARRIDGSGQREHVFCPGRRGARGVEMGLRVGYLQGFEVGSAHGERRARRRT